MKSAFAFVVCVALVVVGSSAGGDDGGVLVGVGLLLGAIVVVRAVIVDALGEADRRRRRGPPAIDVYQARCRFRYRCTAGRRLLDWGEADRSPPAKCSPPGTRVPYPFRHDGSGWPVVGRSVPTDRRQLPATRQLGAARVRDAVATGRRGLRYCSTVGARRRRPRRRARRQVGRPSPRPGRPEVVTGRRGRAGRRGTRPAPSPVGW